MVKAEPYHITKQKLSSSSKKKIQEMLSKQGIAKPSPPAVMQTTVKETTSPAKSHITNGKPPKKQKPNLGKKGKTVESTTIDKNVGSQEKRAIKNVPLVTTLIPKKHQKKKETASPAKSHITNGKPPKKQPNLGVKGKTVESTINDKNVDSKEKRATNNVPLVRASIPKRRGKKVHPQPMLPNIQKTPKSSAGVKSKSKNWTIEQTTEISPLNNKIRNPIKKAHLMFTVESLDDLPQKIGTKPNSILHKRQLAGKQEQSVAKKAKLSNVAKKRQINNFIVTDVQPPGDSLGGDSDDSNADSYIEQFFVSDTGIEETIQPGAAEPKSNNLFIESDSESGSSDESDTEDDSNDESAAEESETSDDESDELDAASETSEDEDSEFDDTDEGQAKENDISNEVETHTHHPPNPIETVLNGKETASKHRHKESTSLSKDESVEGNCRNTAVTHRRKESFLSSEEQSENDSSEEQSEDDSSEFDEDDDTFESVDSDEQDSYADDDSSYSEMSSDDAVYKQFLNGKWTDGHSDDDGDYKPSDIYVSMSDTKYSTIPSNEDYQFDSDISAQIIDLDQPNTDDSTSSSTSSCPQLIHIAADHILKTNMEQPKTITLTTGGVTTTCPMDESSLDSQSDNDNHFIPIQCVNRKCQTIAVDMTVDVVDDSATEDETSYMNDTAIVNELEVDGNSIPNILQSAPLYTVKSTAKEAEQQPSTFKSKFYNSINSQHVLLLLKDTIYFHGILRVKLIAGSAEIFGYRLLPNQVVTANSPRGHCFLYVSPAVARQSNGTSPPSVQLTEFDSTFFQSDLAEITNDFAWQTDAIVLLERAKSTGGVKMLRHHMHQVVLPIANTFSRRRMFYSTECILDVQFFVHTKNGLEIGAQWQDSSDGAAAIEMHAGSRLIVAGGKGVGKSTLIRYLINANLARHPNVLLIDLDIGQPELFVPQTISATIVTAPILGAGYLQNATPLRSLLFGEINVLISPAKYFYCVRSLLEFCQQNADCQKMPWIVNTMGYNRGFGGELMAAILRTLRPTNVIRIDGRRAGDNFECTLTAQMVNEYKFHIFREEMAAIEPVDYVLHQWKTMSTKKHGKRTNEWDIPPKDLRLAMILSRLGSIMQGGQSLMAVRPICAKLSELEVIVPNEDAVNCDLKLQLLNGNLVYLCRRLTVPLEDVSIVECLGIGIVRNVDHNNDTIFLLPAMPLETVSAVTVLAICSIPLPSEIILNQSSRHIDGDIPYVYNTSDITTSKKVVQIPFRPERFTHGSHAKLIE